MWCGKMSEKTKEQQTPISTQEVTVNGHTYEILSFAHGNAPTPAQIGTMADNWGMKMLTISEAEEIGGDTEARHAVAKASNSGWAYIIVEDSWAPNMVSFSKDDWTWASVAKPSLVVSAVILTRVETEEKDPLDLSPDEFFKYMQSKSSLLRD